MKHIHNLKDICSYCNKEYKNKKSLWSHEKKCKIIKEKIMKQAEMIVESIVDKKITTVQQSNEEIQTLNEKTIQLLKEDIQSLTSKIDQVKPNVFNLNIFLNEKCKNAMSIDTFLSQLKIQFDLDHSLQKDAMDGLYKALVDLNVYDRPFHCLDLKRNKICIKDKWTTDPKVFDKVPKRITTLYQEEVQRWETQNEGFLNNSEQLSIYVLHSAKHMQVMNSIKLLKIVLRSTSIPK
jgi:hypothetical protein